MYRKRICRIYCFTRTQYRFSDKTHGDAITFLQQFQGLKFSEAVNYLLAWHGHSRDSSKIKNGIFSSIIFTKKDDSIHHNCVFIGKNAEDKPVFASKRGTYDRDGKGFKGDETGSDKSVAFRLPCNVEIDWVTVFEAPIDLMSFCTLHKNIRSNAVALCGLSEGALDTYLKENPHLKRIVLYLDADKPGRKQRNI